MKGNRERMGEKRMGKGIIAWMLSFVMVLSLVMVPAGKVEAAETVTVTDATNTSNAVYVKMTVEKTIAANSNEAGNWPAQELTQYKVSIVNNTDTTISDWQLTISCSNALDSSTYNFGWNGAPTSVSGKDIIVTTYKGTDTSTGEVWDNATIEAGDTLDTGAGFQVATSFMTNATYTLTYNVGESSGNIGQDATQTDPSQIGTSSSDVKATITQSNIAGDYHEYYLQVNNSSNESISDWLVAIPLTGVSSSEAWGSWAKVKVSYTSSYLYLTPSSGGDNVISAGSSFGSTTEGDYKFNYKGSTSIDTSKAVVYYKTGTASSGAFDNVVDNSTQASGGSGDSGNTGGSGGVQGDTTTDVNLDVEYNFAKLLQESLYFYDANMCGELEGKCALDWRGNCHLCDKTKVSYGGQVIDVSGGFHDAGDHDKFGIPQGYSAAILGIGYYEFKNAYEETGQSAHFKTILDYFCDYFVRCTVLDSNGDAKAFCYQVGDGASHNSWVAAEKENITRPGYFADSSNPATDHVSIAAAALAIHYMNFGNETYLDYAKKLFAMAKTNSKDKKTTDGGTFYTSSSWEDDYCLAAAWLYKATNDASYMTEYNSYKGSIKTGAWPSWDQVGPYALAYGSGDFSPLAANATTTLNSTSTISNGYSWLCMWGSARYNCNMQLEGLIFDKNSGKDQQYTEWATGQMKFLLGNSEDKRCYVVGYNENSSKYPHHRSSSGYSDWPANGNNHTVQAHVLLGALVGGIEDSSGTYHDDSNDYYCNEVAIDYNAAFVGAAAALYLANKDNEAIQKDLATEEELSAIGVTTYYGADDTTNEVTSVSLDKSTLDLKKGETTTLTATVETSDGSTPEISWSSSDEDVATVDSTGKVTAVAGGTAIITAKAGSKKAACEVTVTSAVEGVSLDQTTLTLEKEGTATLVPTIAPADATNKKITWSSDNKKVATVDEMGKVTAVAGGTAIITVTTEDGAKTATCTVTVINPVKSISLNKTSTTIHKGDTETLIVTVNPTDADAHNIQFSSDDESIATVNATTGEITAVSVGTATITATVTQENGTKKFTEACKVEVVVPLTGIAIDKTSLELTTNGDNTTDVLTVSPKPTDAVLGTVTWSSSDETVATVSGTGASATVTAKKSGTATITATVKGENDTYTVTSDVTVTTLFESVSFDKMLIELEQGETTTLVCTITPADVEIEKIEWVKEDTGEHEIIAMTGGDEIIDGKASVSIEALIKGRTWITAIITPKQGDGDSVACEVNVVGKKVTGVELQDKNAAEISELSMTIGDEEQLTAIVTPEDADNKTVTWTSDNVDVVTVDKTGTITAVGKGDAVVTAQAGNVKATCSVKVSKKVQVTPTVHAYTVNKRTSSGFEVSADVSWPETGSTKTLEYSIDGGQTWSSTGVFSGLKTFTKYTVCARAAGNAEYEASKIATETKEIYTLVQDPYTIDVSIFADENAEKYVEAFYAEDGTQTIAYDAKTKTLTLLDTDTTYTITGENTDLVVTAPNDGDVNIVLQNAIIKRLDVTKQNTSSDATVDIEIKGTVQVDEIVSNSDNYVTISGTGTLNASNITVVGELKINGPTVNVDASSDNGEAIVAGKVVIRDSKVNVIGGNGIVAETDVVVNGAEMTITGGAGGTGIVAGENIAIENADVTVSGGNNGAGMVAGESITVSGENVVVTGGAGQPAISSDIINITGGTVNATGGDGAAAISGIEINITGGIVEATGGKGASAIEVTDASGKVSIEKAEVTVNAGDGSKQSAIVADSIVVSSDSKISSDSALDNLYSSTPKDENGKEIAIFTVLLYEEDGKTQMLKASFYSGSQFTLPDLTKQAGCILSWKENSTGKLYEPKAVVTVQNDLTFVISVEKIKVTKITLDSTLETITVGDGVALAETVEPSDAYDDSVTWTSSNPSVATVDKDGNVTGVAAGVTVITANANDGSGKSASCTVTVVEAEPEVVAVEKIKITGATKKVAPGKKLKLKATVYPENATNQTIKWKVNNKKYASVNSKGVVTTKKAGKGKKVTVTAYSAEDNSIKATYKISIMKNAVKKIKLSAKTTTIKKGKSVKVKATFTPAKGISKELTWTSSNKKIATVDSKGKVTGKKKGTVKITAKAKDGSGKKATIKIQVK